MRVVEAAELRTDTLAAFDRYVRATESRMDGELHGKVPFLWLIDCPRQNVWRRTRA